MSKKIAVSFLFAFVFFLFVSQAQAALLTCGGDKTEADCTAAGGTVVNTGGCTSCSIAGSTCPSGMTQYSSWTYYTSKNCGSNTQVCKTGNCSTQCVNPSSCTTSSSSWLNTATAPNCSYSVSHEYSDAYTQCTDSCANADVYCGIAYSYSCYMGTSGECPIVAVIKLNYLDLQWTTCSSSKSNVACIGSGTPPITTCSPGYFLYEGVCTANPIGFFDGLTCTNGTINGTGWAFDGNDVSASINVKFYNGSTELSTVLANQSSADVTAYFANLGQTVTGNHRFVWERAGMAAGTYTISVYGQNTGTAGANTQLGWSPKTVTCSTTTLPTTPTLTASCDSSGLVSASWTAVSGADYYALRIDTDTALPHLLQVDNLTTTSRTWQGTVGTSYNVWVHAIDNGVWSDYDLKNVTCSAAPPPPITYECTGTKPAGTIAWDSEENDDLTQDVAWLYSSSDTSRKCELTCRTGYVRIGGVCVAGPTLSLYISDPLNPGVTDPTRNTRLDDFIIGSSAEFTYAVSGTSTYPVTSCEASVSSANGGNWTGQKLYSDGTYSYPGITPLTTGYYIYYLTCYNSVGAYTTDSVSIRVNTPPPPNIPPTAEITLPSRNDTYQTSSTLNRFEGRGEDTDGTIFGYRWFIDNLEACSAPDPMLYTADSTVYKPGSITLSNNATHNICLRVQDNVGAWTAPDNLALTIGTPPPPPTYHCIDPVCSLPENCGRTVSQACVDMATSLPATNPALCIPACGSVDCASCSTNPPTDGGGGWEEVTP